MRQVPTGLAIRQPGTSRTRPHCAYRRARLILHDPLQDPTRKRRRVRDFNQAGVSAQPAPGARRLRPSRSRDAVRSFQAQAQSDFKPNCA
jgi:hypothetical protein